MKKVMALVVLAVFASTTVMAYDHLITNDTAKVQEAGSMKAEAQLLYWTASEEFDQDGESYDMGDDSTKLAVPVKFRYGVMDGLEAFGVLGLLEKWDFGDDGESGIGDLWLGAKYAVLDEDQLTIRGALDIPLGDDEKGLGYPGGFGIDVAAMSCRDFDIVAVDCQAGLRWNAEDGDTKVQPGIAFYLDGEGAYTISDVLKAQAGLELMFEGDQKVDGNDVKDSGRNWIELNLGATYALGDNMGLKGDFIINLAGKNTEKNMGVLLRYCYGF